MTTENKIGLILILAITVIISSAFIPEYIRICSVNDPNIARCINNSINNLRPRFKSGIPELEVPPLEPMIVKEIKLKRGPSGSGINCNITNLKVWGPASFVITELKPDLRKNEFFFKVWLPRLHFAGNYKLDMKILLINIRGNGLIFGNFSNYRSEIVMKGRKITKNNQEYLKFDKIRQHLTIGKSKIRLENLFNNNPTLRRITDDLINENSDLFIEEIKPGLENVLSETFTEIANKITLRFTYKELFSNS